MNVFLNFFCYKKKEYFILKFVKILIKVLYIILYILLENMNGYVNFIGICKGFKCKECKIFRCWSLIKMEICFCS